MNKKPYSEWVEFLAKHPDKVDVVEDGDAAEIADVVICRLVTSPLMMPDNLVGHCSKCFRMVQFRPYAPKTPMRVCDECAGQMFKKEMKDKDFKSFITPNTMRDVQDYLRKKGSH